MAFEQEGLISNELLSWFVSNYLDYMRRILVWRMNWKAQWRKQWQPNKSTILAFAWIDRRKPRKSHCMQPVKFALSTYVQISITILRQLFFFHCLYIYIYIYIYIYVCMYVCLSSISLENRQSLEWSTYYLSFMEHEFSLPNSQICPESD
jgi:hypothetical protein